MSKKRPQMSTGKIPKIRKIDSQNQKIDKIHSKDNVDNLLKSKKEPRSTAMERGESNH